MTQGERVRDIRKSLNLTLEKFGEKLGVKKSAISDIESGRNSLTDQMTRAICREYNVNYDWLISEEGDPFSDLPQTVLNELCKQYNLDDFDKALVEMYIEFPENIRKHLKENLLKMLKRVDSDSSMKNRSSKKEDVPWL